MLIFGQILNILTLIWATRAGRVPIGEGVGLLVVAEKGAGEADAGNGGARGHHDLGVPMGSGVGAAQSIGAGIAPSARGSPGNYDPLDQGGQER